MSRKTYSLVFPSQYEYIDGPEYVSQRVWKFPYLGFRTTGYCGPRWFGVLKLN